MNVSTSGWYVIYTRPRNEKRVSRQLDLKGFPFLLPLTKSIRMWNKRKKYLETPMFPSYIFVNLHKADEYFEVLNMEGVLYFIRMGKSIAKVSDTVINNIRLIEKEPIELEISDEHFQPGRQVVIKEGTLTDLSGEIVEVKGKEKLLVRVSLLQRNILMSLPKEYVNPVVA
jgi:transcription antitermination factor NusG